MQQPRYRLKQHAAGQPGWGVRDTQNKTYIAVNLTYDHARETRDHLNRQASNNTVRGENVTVGSKVYGRTVTAVALRDHARRQLFVGPGLYYEVGDTETVPRIDVGLEPAEWKPSCTR